MEEELVHEAYVVKPIFGGHDFFFRLRELLSSGQICVPWYNVVIAVQPRKKRLYSRNIQACGTFKKKIICTALLATNAA